MKLSVVIVCHNAVASLGRAVVSVLEQGFADLQILVVDDASTDGSVALAERLSEEIAECELIRLEASRGRGAARNAGLARARGDYVAFLDAEDAYGSGVVAKVIGDLDNFLWADGIEFGVRLAGGRAAEAAQLAVVANSLCGCIITRRAFLEAIGGFPADDAFRDAGGDPDSAFRLTLRRWGTIGSTGQVSLEHTLQPASPSAKFLDTSRVVDGRLEMPPPDDEATARDAAARAHLLNVDAAMFRSINEPKRHAIHCDVGGRQFDFEVPDRPELIGEATAALANTGYPSLPFLGAVQVVVELGAGAGASAVYHACNNIHARVIALEATRRGFVLLRGNSFAHANLETYRVGLYDATTRLDLLSADGTGSSTERVLMAQAAAFLSSLRIEHIDVLNMDNRGCEVAALYALAGYLPRIKSILIRYYRDTDRRLIDAMLMPTHMLYWGRSNQPNQGQFLYVRRTLLGPDGER
jgi:hypothetical protein